MKKIKMKSPARRRSIKTVGIVAKVSSNVALELAKKAALFLAGMGISVISNQRTSQGCGMEISPASDGEFSSRADLVLVLGGDGTFIEAVSLIRQRPVPVLGVNMGSLGFLTDVKSEEIFDVLGDVVSGNFKCEERMRLRTAVRRGQTTVWQQEVLNEVVLLKNAMSPTIHIDVFSDGIFVSRFRGDGLMAATPTGSTAYNLSSNGPIVCPTLRCILLTPISPHMLADRSIILPDGVKVSIKLCRSRGGQTFANFDGLMGIKLDEGDEILVEASPSPALVVVPGSRDYFNVLRTKLKWGEE